MPNNSRPSFLLITTAFFLLATRPVAAGPATTWRSFHGSSGLTGFSKADIPDTPARLWRFKAESEVSGTPVSDGNHIYFADIKGRIYAISTSGESIWTYNPSPTNTMSFSAPLVCVQGSLVIGSDQGTVLALNSTSGTLQWTYNSGEPIGNSATWTETPEAKIIVIGQAAGSIHCIDLQTGKPVWKINEMNRCEGAPATGNDKLVFGNCDAALYTFSIATGKKTGATDLNPAGQVAGGAALDNKLAFTGTHGGDLICVDFEANKILWRFHDTDNSIYTTPALSTDKIICASDRGTVYCLTKKSGQLIWKTETQGTPTSPVIADSKVILTNDGVIYILSLIDGKVLWSYDLSDEATSPAIINGMIVVGSDDSYVTAFGKP